MMLGGCYDVVRKEEDSSLGQGKHIPLFTLLGKCHSKSISGFYLWYFKNIVQDYFKGTRCLKKKVRTLMHKYLSQLLSLSLKLNNKITLNYPPQTFLRVLDLVGG